jgi:hypothetical protein
MKLLTIISGGQTGADRGALEGAKKAGLPTGGTAPKGYLTEKGPDPDLKKFGLKESFSADYAVRTERNVLDADGTAIFATRLESDGTRITIQLAKKYKKPLLVNPTAEELKKFAQGKKILNIAGNRESISPGLQAKVAQIIEEAFRK